MHGSPRPIRDPVFSRPLHPRAYPAGARGSLRQFRHDAFDRDTSPLLVADHVQAAGPEIEPLPHAGLSIATLLFEHAAGAIDSTDSAGAQHCIRPGDLHWTLAGRGVVRRTQALGETQRIDALRILVNSPRSLKLQPPASYYLAAGKVPVIHGSGSRLRLLIGALGDIQSPLQLPQPLQLLDGHLDADATVRLPLPAGWNAWIYAASGELSLQVEGSDPAFARKLAAATAVSANAQAGDLTLELRGIAALSHVVVLAGAAIHEPLVQHGPFVMNTRQDIERVVGDYEAGRLGRL